MRKKPRLVLIANTSSFLRIYVLKHIETLSRGYKVYVCCNNANQLKNLVPRNVSLIEINFKRGISFFNDVLTFFKTLFFSLQKNQMFQFHLLQK